MSTAGLGCSESEQAASSRSAAPPRAGAEAPAAPKKTSPKKTSPKKTSPDGNALVDRGRAVYVANCTACHNPNPSLPGGLGPDVGGSSIELLEARLLHTTYPPGYTPKRDSRVMMALPYLKDDIPALAAYLNR